MANRTLTDTTSVAQDVSVAGVLKLNAKPGGTTLQIQYNNAGAFDGIPGSSWNGTLLLFPNIVIGGYAPGAPQLLVSPDQSAFMATRQDSTSTPLNWYGSKLVASGAGLLCFWSAAGFGAGSIDTAFSRTAAATVALGNGTAADISGSLKLTDLFTNNTTFLLRAGVALANAAAASTATLTNAPVAGNPTKWISIDDAGTTRRIPAW